MGLYHVGPNGQVYVKDISGIMGRKGRYVKEHRYVMAMEMGRPLRGDEYVIHIDGDHMNNDPSNLRIVCRREIGSIFGRDNAERNRKDLRFVDSISLGKEIERMRMEGDLGSPRR